MFKFIKRAGLALAYLDKPTFNVCLEKRSKYIYKPFIYINYMLKNEILSSISWCTKKREFYILNLYSYAYFTIHIYIYSVFPFSYCLLAAQFPHLEQYYKNNTESDRFITD